MGENRSLREYSTIVEHDKIYAVIEGLDQTETHFIFTLFGMVFATHKVHAAADILSSIIRKQL